MDIVVAHNFYKQPGGEDQCVSSEVAMLRAGGHNVAQYCLRNEAIDRMSKLRLASDTIWNRSAFRELRALFRAHRPQLVHFHNSFPLISPAGYYAARAENVRIVQTLHNFRLCCPSALLFRDGQICEDCLSKTIPWAGILHKCYRDNRAASTGVAAMLTVHRALGTWQNAIDVYVALTEFSRKKFVEGGLPARKIRIKPNFVYPDPGPGAGRGGYAVFVGRLSAEKGLQTLLDAWENLAGTLPLKLVGDGPMSPMIREATVKNPAIQWLGRKPLESLYPILGEAMFLVVPSQCYETFARVVIEAFAKGTPVIASKLGAMAEIVDNGRTGLHFNPGDPRDLIAKVRQMIEDADGRHRMRRAAREEFDNKYTADINLKVLSGIYRHALERHSDL
ncbi:MAG: glycosyltransferase family 4 protein [Acidobacteriaceae bacterium]|nr:glycosyltransferase family 4 protein [Acidobacteriaceae bacterium]